MGKENRKGGKEMVEIAFQYDPTPEDKWVRCENPSYIHEEIEKLPHFLVLESQESEKGAPKERRVFCPYHRVMEDVAEIRRGRVVSAAGCVLDGLVAMEAYQNKGQSHLWGFYWVSRHHGRSMNGVLVPFRWRIFQRETQGPLNIACDVAEIHQGHYQKTGKFRQWHCFSFSADVGKRKQYITRRMKNSVDPSTAWTQETGIRVPEIVLETSLELLREGTKLATGIKPSVLSRMKGLDRVTAYIERPFDLNIVFLKQFLREFIGRDFDGVFPYDCKDNYRIVCRLLAIDPPKSLRKAYGFNPYSVVWYTLFRQWGVKDVNLMQKFFCLDRRLAGVPLGAFYYDKTTGRVKWDDEKSRWDTGRKWQALEHLCARMLEKKGEKGFLRWLHKISTTEEMQPWQWDLILAFHRYEDVLSEDLKRIFVRDGLTQYVHDQIGWEVTAHSHKLAEIRLLYPPHIMAYECNINGYSFRLVKDTHTLRHAGLLLQNCVATYRDNVVRHHSTIVTVRHQGQYVACIELKPENTIVQALGPKNQRLAGETLQVCRYWARLKKLGVATSHMALCEDSPPDLEQAAVEEIPHKETAAEMSAAEDFPPDADEALERLSEAARNGDKIAAEETERLKKFIDGKMTRQDLEMLWSLQRVRRIVQTMQDMAEE